MTFDNYIDFFTIATGYQPYPYQIQLASIPNHSAIINIPTGMGKTAGIILSWVWRRRFHEDNSVRNSTPRRLVFCLPMRVLVEQTSENASRWLQNLELLGGVFVEQENVGEVNQKYHPSWKNPEKITVTTLMGGEDADEWDKYPERDAIIIGTQDMLLSRALNRGYGMSRYRWPVHFGLLNNDCLWVMDEVQLMGVGLATGVQMAAFRSCIGTMESTNTQTLWMSATLKKEWLRTVDFNPEKEIPPPFTLTENDYSNPGVKARIHATKILQKSPAAADLKELAGKILDHHHSGTRTLVVINTVRRAREIYSRLAASLKKSQGAPKTVLIHAQFRPGERKERVKELLEPPGHSGSIIISTQVVEAGVDVSAKTLFTELAPWSSLVQRFGRCNRSGEHEAAEIFWIDVATGTKSQAAPYADIELDESRKILESLEGKNVSPANLPSPGMPLQIRHVLRRKDITELFDTTPDLTGHDTDISRFVRESSDTDVHVFWRAMPDGSPGDADPLPSRDELCPAPIREVRDLVSVKKAPMKGWYWDSLEDRWIPVTPAIINPGLNIMLDARAGYYSTAEGWNVKSKEPVPVLSQPEKSPDDSYDGQTSSVGDWETIATHTDHVLHELSGILSPLNLPDPMRYTILDAARWHDCGKAHPAFQANIEPKELAQFPGCIAAKAPRPVWKRGRIMNPDDGRRRFFRHELASGILALQQEKPDLVAYLAAAHHGKVRLSIRSLPDEFLPPDTSRRFARGVWDGDQIPKVDLGGGVSVPDSVIDMSYMDLGEGSRGPSWLARMLTLRDQEGLGIFRLAYMEALMKAADERASRGSQ